MVPARGCGGLRAVLEPPLAPPFVLGRLAGRAGRARRAGGRVPRGRGLLADRRLYGGPTLDGLRWLEQQDPDDAAAIRWLRSTASGAPVVLETVGPDFDPEGRGRVSTFTGLAHRARLGRSQLQWGHDPGMRGEDVVELYETRDLARARALLRRYRVRYVVVGGLERRDYPRAGLAKFGRLGDPVFRSGDTVVYEVGGSPAA